MSYDASATWSGFNYQGKIALYHTLCLINEKLNEDVNFEFSDYELILENHEDFDIKGPNGFESFHQVKAINKTAFSTYENALFAMLLQLDTPENAAVIGYLHTWKPLRWTGGNSFKEKLRGIVHKIILDNTDNLANSYIQKAFTEDTIVDKKVKIIRQAKNQDARLVDVEDVLGVVTGIHDAVQPEAVVERIKLYDYGGVLACSIDDIDQKVKGKISTLHDVLDIASNEDSENKIFCSLLAKLDENIILKHSNLNDGDESPISISEILSIVVDSNIRDSDNAYLASSFKLQFIDAFERYLDDDELCSPDDAEAYLNSVSNLNAAMKVLLELSALDLWAYFKNLNPHLHLDADSAIMNAQHINLPNLRQYLFRIFSDMNSDKFCNSYQKRVVHYFNKNKCYLPTAIAKDSKKTLVRSIMENGNAIRSLYEVSAMITGDENAPEIERFSDEYTKLANVDIEKYYEIEPQLDKEKITQVSRNIRLIRGSTAMEEINDA